jgi:8-oxo-dGTP diphosphatase
MAEEVLRKILRVSAGLLTKDGKVLTCQRRASDRHGLKWEFPGGKATDGEDPAACLWRELKEELGINAVIGQELWQDHHIYPDRTEVFLTFLHVPTYAGELRNLAFERILWVRPADLLSYDFLAGDLPFVQALAQGHILLLPPPNPLPPGEGE